MAAERAQESAAEVLYGLLLGLVRRTPRDMSLTAVSTLSTLERTGTRRITELAVIEGVAQPSMTSLVSSLEREGFVERRKDPGDKRVALVAITDKGMKYLGNRRRLSTEALERLLGGLSEAESIALAGAADALAHLRRLDEEDRDLPRPPLTRRDPLMMR